MVKRFSIASIWVIREKKKTLKCEFCSIALKKVNIINIETRIHIHIRVYFTRTPKNTNRAGTNF